MQRCFLFLFFVLPLLLSSCSDYHEINDTAMVAGIGIDKGESSPFKVSVEIIRPAAGESESPTSKVLSEEGTNVEDCLKRLVTVANKELHFSHCKLILFSEDIAKEGISDLVDSFLRDPQYRADLFLAVVAQGSAAEMLTVEEKEERIVSFDCSSVIENSFRETGGVPPTKLYQFPMDGKETLIPIFEKKDQEYCVGGAGLFTEGKLKGKTNLALTRSILLTSSEFKRGELLLSAESGDDIPCQIVSVNVKREVRDETPITVSVEIKCSVRLTSLPDGFDLSTPEGVEHAEEKISQLMSESLQKDWNNAVKSGVSDAFGLSLYVYRHAPHLYEDWKNGNRGDRIILDPKCEITLENFGFTDERIAK